MDDALVVRGRETAGDLPSEVDRLGHRQAARGHALAQRPALEELEDDEGRPRHADVVHDQDVRVADGGRGPRLGLEAPQALRVVGERFGQDLERHEAPQPLVARAIDLAHAAGAEGRLHHVGAEPLTGSEGHGSGTGQASGCTQGAR